MTSEDDLLWDVLIVGAGPAGATAAYHLTSAGFSVLLLDKKEFPREKVCGDALIPDTLHGLRAMGLYEAVRELGFCVDRLTIMSPSGIRVELPAECVTLRREVLDRLMVQQAVASGSVFRTERVTGLREATGAVHAKLADSQLEPRARIVVLATGADVALLDKLDMVMRRRPSAVALRCYMWSPVEIEELIVSYERRIAPGYAWIFPLGCNQYNVGCGVFLSARDSQKVNLRTVFERFTKETTVARRLLQKSQTITPLKGARIRAGLDGSVMGVKGRVVPIGETIGATYPFTGEGIGKAMETAAVAAEHIASALETDDMEPVKQLAGEIERRLAPKYRGYHVAQRWLAHPWLSDLMASRMRTDRSLRDKAAGILNETVDPKTLFTWRSLVPNWRTTTSRLTRWRT
jgi:geranylgeranyl reductase family protein